MQSNCRFCCTHDFAPVFDLTDNKMIYKKKKKALITFSWVNSPRLRRSLLLARSKKQKRLTSAITSNHRLYSPSCAQPASQRQLMASESAPYSSRRPSSR